MFKTKGTFLVLLVVIASLFSACASKVEVAETTESTVVSTEPTAPAEAVVVTETTVSVLLEKADFTLHEIDGQDCYVMNEFSYPAKLGTPVLGLEGAAALYQEGDIDSAANVIDNVGDAIHYVMEMEAFNDSREACEAFMQLLEDDYSDYGYITLQGKDFSYCLAYVNYYQFYYPIDVFNVTCGRPSWIVVEENGCAPSEDVYTLCDNIAATFPGDMDVESWIMESLTIPEPEYNLTKYLYPWELKAEELGSEKVSNLYAVGNQYATEKTITTLDDAITYIKLMDPGTWFQSPMQGRPAWKVLVYLLADDYEDVGVINLMMRKPEHREGFYDQSAYLGSYRLCYVQKDGVYYPIDIDAILRGWTSWSLLPGNECYSSRDLNDLCKKMAATFTPNPGDGPMTYWESTSYMYHQGTKMIPVNEFVIPEALGHPVLSDEEIEELVQETDYEKIAQKITTLADALHFYNKLRLVRPNSRATVNRDSMIYHPSAWQVLKDKTAFGAAAGNVTRYLLKEDYDEIGYVLARTATIDSQFTYIYEDGFYYLLYTATYPTDPREDLWIEWPEMIGCAEDLQTIVDSAIEHMCFYSPQYYEKVKEIYFIRCEGDLVYGTAPQGVIFPEGTDVIAYCGSEPTYVETTLDWQSQTRIDK